MEEKAYQSERLGEVISHSRSTRPLPKPDQPCPEFMWGQPPVAVRL